MNRKMRNPSTLLIASLALLLALASASPAWAQSNTQPQSGTGKAAAQPQLPDAPQPQSDATAPPAPETPIPGSSPEPAAAPTAPDWTPPGPPPANPITTTKPGTQPSLPLNARDQLYTLTRNVNFVLLPVTIKNSDGHLVEGLVPKDFSVYEDGMRQRISFFTSDPFPLSAAIVLDLGLANTDWKKVRDTLPALVGAFSQFDEVALFTYSNIVQKVQDFSSINANQLAASLHNIKSQSGKQGGAPVVGGPFGGGPSVNGQPVIPGTPQVATYEKESSVLNDAILAAANELNKREPSRRKLLFVISDGRELGSANKYADVLRVLLTRQISVYAIGVGGGGMPVYRQLEKIRIPGQGYGDILPKYASATGGQVFPEFTQKSIEDAYAQVTEEARNQYTLGYNTIIRPGSGYRSIEVRIDRPGLKVFAKDGYYPLPPAAGSNK
jgi:VWFA-related protein